jgi:predicted Zn-dependent peptidase
VTREVMRTLATLRRGRIALEELRRAQRRLRMQLDFTQDAPGDLCGWFAGTELFRKAETFEEKIAQADAVTVKDLQRVARTYLVAERLITVAVGPRTAKAPMVEALAQAARLLGR